MNFQKVTFISWLGMMISTAQASDLQSPLLQPSSFSSKKNSWSTEAFLNEYDPTNDFFEEIHEDYDKICDAVRSKPMPRWQIMLARLGTPLLQAYISCKIRVMRALHYVRSFFQPRLHRQGLRNETSRRNS